MSRFSLSIPFPEPWGVLTSETHIDQALVDDACAEYAQLDPDAAAAMREGLTQLGDYLLQFGIDGFASLFIPGEEPQGLVQAWCGVALLPNTSTSPNSLREIALGNPFDVLESELTMMQRRDGHMARASFLRAATQLADGEGCWPYLASVRYVFGIGGEVTALLHFETITLAYLDELTEMFDAIALAADAPTAQ